MIEWMCVKEVECRFGLAAYWHSSVANIKLRRDVRRPAMNARLIGGAVEKAAATEIMELWLSLSTLLLLVVTVM